MSKVGDIKKMYGQDFSIIVTNAPAQVINNYTTYSHGPKLLSNILLVSSPMENGEDIKNPTLFVTDYNGEPLQLTYAVSFGNGLTLNDNGNISMAIDNSTIKASIDNNLYVNTSSLDVIGNNKLGIAKINETINRYNDKIPDSTFISTDTNGTLYLAASFFDWMDKYINKKINDAIRPLINTTLSSWIIYYKDNDESTKYNSNEPVNINNEKIDGNPVEITFDFYYKSMSNSPEQVSISYDDQYPILSLPDTLTSIVYSEETIGDQTVYTHKISNINISFYPNLHIENNNFVGLNYLLSIMPNRNNADNTDNSNIFLLKIVQSSFNPKNDNSLTINNDNLIINELVTAIENNNNNNENKTYKFSLSNKFSNIFNNKNFTSEDINFNLKISCVTNTNSITIYNGLINDKIVENEFNVDIPITSNWVDCLVNKNQTTNKYIQIGASYSMKCASSNYKVELTIKVNDHDETYTSDNFIEHNYSTNVDKESKIIETNKDEISDFVLNGETMNTMDSNNLDNPIDYSFIANSNSDQYTILIKNIDKLISINNNKFNINLKYTVKTKSGVLRPISFNIDSINETNSIGGDIEIPTDTISLNNNSNEEMTFNPFNIKYENENYIQVLNAILLDKLTLEIKSSSFTNNQNRNVKQLNIMVDESNEQVISKYLFDNIEIYNKTTQESYNIGENNTITITTEDIPNIAAKINEETLASNIFKIDTVTINQENNNLTVNVKLNTDEDSISWSNGLVYNCTINDNNQGGDEPVNQENP